jgi:hypothetical protein
MQLVGEGMESLVNDGIGRGRETMAARLGTLASETVNTMIGDGMTALANGASWIADKLSGVASAVSKTLSDGFSFVDDLLGGAISKMGASLKNAAGGAGSMITAAAAVAGSLMSAGLSLLVNAVTGTAQKLVSLAGSESREATEEDFDKLADLQTRRSELDAKMASANEAKLSKSDIGGKKKAVTLSKLQRESLALDKEIEGQQQRVDLGPFRVAVEKEIRGLGTFVANMLSNLPDVALNVIFEMGESVLMKLVENLPRFLSTMMEHGITAFTTRLPDIVSRIASAFVLKIPDMVAAIGTGIVAGIENAFATVIKWIESVLPWNWFDGNDRSAEESKADQARRSEWAANNPDAPGAGKVNNAPGFAGGSGTTPVHPSLQKPQMRGVMAPGSGLRRIVSQMQTMAAHVRAFGGGDVANRFEQLAAVAATGLGGGSGFSMDPGAAFAGGGAMAQMGPMGSMGGTAAGSANVSVHVGAGKGAQRALEEFVSRAVVVEVNRAGVPARNVGEVASQRFRNLPRPRGLQGT